MNEFQDSGVASSPISDNCYRTALDEYFNTISSLNFENLSYSTLWKEFLLRDSATPVIESQNSLHLTSAKESLIFFTSLIENMITTFCNQAVKYSVVSMSTKGKFNEVVEERATHSRLEETCEYLRKDVLYLSRELADTQLQLNVSDDEMN